MNALLSRIYQWEALG